MTRYVWIGLAVWLCATTLPTAIGCLTAWRDRRWLRRSVFANLDSAAENGYFEPGEHLYGATPDEIAHDMALHAEDLGALLGADIVPYVREWLSKGNRI